MQTKGPHPATYLQGTDAPPLIRACFEWSHLKQLYRQGWLRRGIPPERCESVAEHTFGVAMLALFLADTSHADLDPLKVLRIALLHDLGEVYAGDLTPGDAVDPEEKHALEEQSVIRVLSKLPQGPGYIALWQEYEQGASPEARLVRQVDRLEMALQAALYEHQEQIALPDFFDSADAAISWPALHALLAAVKEIRPAHLEHPGHA
jgi:putative hydrolase of HD superfamily